MTTKIPVELSSTPSIVDNGDATAITIDSDEKVGIGTTSPAEFLQVHGGIKTTGGFLANTANSMGMSYASNYGHFISWGDNSTQGKFKFTGTAGDGSPTGDLASLDSDGLKFGSDTAAANALDDYEEGTWTPAIAGSTNLNIFNTEYIKIGRKVYAYFYVSFNPVSNSNQFEITGLPYGQSGTHYGGGTVNYTGAANWSDEYGPIIAGSTIYFHKNSGTSASLTNADVYSKTSGSQQYLLASIHFYTA
jgi:hypothetical protein